MKDYEWMNRVSDRRRGRLAAMFPDEEPDDEALTGSERAARADRAARAESDARKRERGELAPEGQ